MRSMTAINISTIIRCGVMNTNTNNSFLNGYEMVSMDNHSATPDRTGGTWPMGVSLLFGWNRD